MLSTLVSMVGNLFGGMLFLMYLVYSLLISCGLFFGAGLLLVFTSSQLSVPRVRYGHHCRGNCEMETINLIDAQNKYIPPINIFGSQKVLFSINQVANAILGIAVMWSLLSIGQDLANKYRDIGGCLEHLLINEFENLEEKQRAQLEILIKR